MSRPILATVNITNHGPSTLEFKITNALHGEGASFSLPRGDRTTIIVDRKFDLSINPVDSKEQEEKPLPTSDWMDPSLRKTFTNG